MPAALVFAPSVLSGFLVAHLLWPERGFRALFFKLFLGTGLGLGLRSLLYFLHLMIFPAGGAFLVVELAMLILVLGLAARRQLADGRAIISAGQAPSLTPAQTALGLVAAVVIVISLLTTANYLLRRRQGDWDAWMMYNRAARFIHRDQEHWRDSFSPQMDPIFHADYPLLLAANISGGWDTLGRDSAAVPMQQSALFAIACAGLIAAALALGTSIGQAALGVIFLWGVPVFVNEGARQMADVPMAFFLLAVGCLIYLYVRDPGPGLLALAGIAAGLAAWTKNEGAVTVIGAASAVAIVLGQKRQWERLLHFGAGLVPPLAIVLYFKFFLAPSGDILTGASGGLMAKLLDGSRHMTILRHIGAELVGFGSWGIAGSTVGIVPMMALFYLAFRKPIAAGSVPGFAGGLVILGIQMLGYYAAYLVSPYDLDWHLAYSSTRIVLQVFPLLLFLTLGASRAAEAVLAPGSVPATE